jgi:hypothetical protein
MATLQLGFGWWRMVRRGASEFNGRMGERGRFCGQEIPAIANEIRPL